MKNINPIFTFVLLVLFSSSAFAQHGLWDKHQQEFESLNKKNALSPLLSLDQKDATLTGFTNHEVLSIDRSITTEIYTDHPAQLKLSIPFQGSALELLLIENDIYTDKTIFKLGDGSFIGKSADRGIHYYGVMSDDHNALVSISIYKNEIVGLISQNDQQLTLAKQESKDNYILYKTKDVIDPPTFSCDTDDVDHFIGNSEEKVVFDVNNCVNMYIEVDHDIYNTYGSTTATLNYITAVFNQVSTLYANESIDFNISELVIWDLPDPYTGPSTSNYLTQFRNTLNGNYNGDLAHLVGFSGGGGVAYVDVLCNSYYGVGYSAITTSYNTVPSYSWTVEVLTHEIGHNLGSQHTHACAWNGNNTAIDGCGPAAGYSEGCDAPVPSSGTIMSYCHLVSGIGIDFNLGFGTQPGDRIRNEVYNASCLSPCSGGGCTTIGDACDDGDACTSNDTVDANCDCLGIYTDADNDGYCIGDDPNDNDQCIPDGSGPLCNSDCTVEDYQGFEAGWGIWNDGGSDVARVLSTTYSTDSYSIRLRDNSGVASATTTGNLLMSSYESIEVAFSYFPVSMENTEDFFLEVSTDNGSSFTIVESWVRGVDFDNNTAYSENVAISGFTLTDQTQIRFRCDASGNSDWIYLDEVYISGCGSSGGGGCTTVGDPCDDGDDCTSGETIDASCNCSGGVFQDMDDDGICDAEDLCPNMDDNLIGSGCDDGDDCTVDDTYMADCSCQGSYVDADNDGYCVGEDDDDNDPCVPDNSGPGCDTGDPCIDVDFEDFESGWGIWNDGGADCRRSTNTNAPGGSTSIRLRDDSNSSVMYTDVLNLGGYTSFDVSFSFKSLSFANGESFLLEYSTNGGSSYSAAGEWVNGVHFNNGSIYSGSISMSGVTLSTSTTFRFRCDASTNADRVFIDDIAIEACGLGSTPAGLVGNEDSLDQVELEVNQELEVYPNPLTRGNDLVIELSVIPNEVSVALYNLQGQQVYSQLVQPDGHKIMLSTHDLEPGAYICIVHSSDQTWTKKLIVQ